MIRRYITLGALFLAPFIRDGSTDSLEVTPSSGTVDAPPYAQAYPVNFSVTNTGSRTVDVAISAPGCQPHEQSCAWSTFSLDDVLPNESRSLTITVTTGAPGSSGTVGFIALVNDNQTVQAGTTVTVRVPQQAWLETKALNPGTTIERSHCVAFPIATNAAYECGDLRIAHAAPSLRVRNDDRTPVLLYNSAHAEPRPVVLADISTPNATSVTNVTATLTVRRGGSDVQVASQQLGTLPAASTQRVALTYDASSDTTGIYPYTMTVSMTVDGQPQSPISTSDTLVVVNRKTSPFGAGWWLAGYERLVPLAGGSFLWVGGDGSTRRYAPDSANPGVFRTLGLYRPDSLTLQGSTYVRMLRHRAQVQFDLSGRHVATVDPLNSPTTFQHDGSGRLQLIIHPTASQPRHALYYSAGGLLDSLTGPGPISGTRRITLLHGSGGRVERITDPDGIPVNFGFDTLTGLVINSRTNRNGVTQTFGFASNRLVQATVPLTATESAVTTFCPAEIRGLVGGGCGSAPLPPGDATTTVDGPRTDVADLTTIRIDRFGQPVLVTDPIGNSIRLYRGNRSLPGLVTRTVDKNGKTDDAFYNATGTLGVHVDYSPLGPDRDAQTHFDWDPRWERLTQITYPEGNIVRFGYDSTTGNRIWQEDGRGISSRVDFAYNGSIGNDALLLASITYPADRQARRSTDAVSYDTLGNVASIRTAVATPDSGVATITHDGVGRAETTKTLINVSGAQQRDVVTYDLIDRVLTTQSSGPVLNTTLPETLSVSRTYDAEGNVRKVERRSSPDTPTPSIGVITSRSGYDLANRVVADTAPDGRVERRTYDRAGNVISITTRRDSTITMTYDPLNRLSSRTLPPMAYGERKQGIYFVAGGNASQPRPSSNIGYPRFNLGPTNRLVVPGDTETFNYDAMGNLTRAANGSAIVRRSYYTNTLLSDEIDSVRTYSAADFSQHVYTLHNDYDYNGRRIRLTLPAGLTQSPVAGTKNVITFAYDPASGFLSTVTDPLGKVFNYGYDGPGRLAELQMPGGIGEGWQYDLADRLSIDSITNTPASGGNRFTGALLRRVRFRYDTRGLLDSAANGAGKKDTLAARYSGLGHLVRSTYSDSGNAFFPPPSGGPGRYSSVERFTYDGLANIRADTLTYSGRTNWRSQTDSGPRSRTYEAGTGRLKTIVTTAVDVDSLFYDASGNVVFSTRQAFPNALENPPVEDLASFYDAAERLRVVDHRRSEAFRTGPRERYPIVFEFEEFRYDALGRRVLNRARRSCNPFNDLFEDACGLSFIKRVLWDGSQQAMEIQQPGDSAASPAVLENDVGPTPIRSLYQGTNGEFIDPNAFFGRVAYAHGAALDAPLSITRWEYADSASLQVGVPNGYQRWTEPFTLVPHWTSRGAPDNGTFADGGKTLCGGGGIATRCVKIAWPFGFSAYKQKTFRSISWHGSLLEENRDASGLLYRRNRYVDPNTGQFTQEDPIGLAGGMNLYGFAGSDPVNYADPFGLQLCCSPLDLGPQLIAGWQQTLANEALQMQLDWVFTIHGQLVTAGTVQLAGGALSTLGAARSTANAAQAAGRKQGMAAALEVEGQVFTATSGRGPLNPGLQKVLDETPPPHSAFHGACAEINCISRAMDAGVDPSGGTMSVVKIRKPGHPAHGTVAELCPTCAQVIKRFGITVVP